MVSHRNTVCYKRWAGVDILNQLIFGIKKDKVGKSILMLIEGQLEDIHN